jgi:hypothetical protein
VGHQPALVGRVAREAAAQVVVDAAALHAVERLLHRRLAGLVALQLAAPQQDLQGHGVRKLRALAEAAVGIVAARQQAPRGAVEQARSDSARVRAHAQPCDAADGAGDLLRLGLHLAAARAVGVDHRVEHGGEAGHPVALRRREVGAGEEGALLRGEEDGEGPAAGAAHELHHQLVDVIEVGPLLAVDLHVDEELVHLGGDGLVLEALPLHHVAPVAGRVADAEQDRLVVAAGALERLLAPRVPVDGVVRMLQQVRRGLARQAVVVSSHAAT